MHCNETGPHWAYRDGYDDAKGGAQWKEDKCEACGWKGIALGDDVVVPDGCLLVTDGEVLSRVGV